MESDKSGSINQISQIQLEEARKRSNASTSKRNPTGYFREYCGNTSIHGFKYLAEERTLAERLWWIISISLSLSLCVVLVTKTYEKWQNSPVIVSLATQETPAWQVPFPAVTICPATKSVPLKFNYTEVLLKKKGKEQITDDEEKKLTYLSLICEDIHGIKFKKKNQFESTEFMDFLDEIQPDFFNTISECWFLQIEYNCSDLFFPIITDDGICYTFNLLDRSQMFRENVAHYKHYHKAPELSNWTLEHGYHPGDPIETYPKRALFAGADFALQAKMTVYEDELDYFCGDSVQGFKMEIFHPSGIPQTYEHHIKLPLNQAVLASVEPVIMVTSEAVRKYDARKRNCYFPSERSLKYFKVYTQANCRTECKTNITLKKCGCADFFMPREESHKVCSGADLTCIYDAETEMLIDEVNRNIVGSVKMDDSSCDCLPSCNSMQYHTEISQSDWNWRRQFPSNNSNKYMSYFKIFFKTTHFITSERKELFGSTDFLANFGGLLGLFTGFSLLSFIEIVYYLTLRIVANVRLHRNWYGIKNNQL